MGYYSTIEGRLDISPPVPLRTLAGTSYLESDFCLKYEVAESREEVDGGTLLRENIVAIVPSWEDQMKAYSLKDDLIEMVAELDKAGSTCSGELIRVGEGQGDVERFRANGGIVTSEVAELRWPDGQPVGNLY